MRRPQDIIIKPVVTEKTTALMEENKYVFYVNKKSNKSEIKNAIQKLFDVKVEKVRTMNLRGKFRRMGRYEGYTSSRKKAIVTLQEGDSIQLFENI